MGKAIERMTKLREEVSAAIIEFNQLRDTICEELRQMAQAVVTAHEAGESREEIVELWTAYDESYGDFLAMATDCLLWDEAGEYIPDFYMDEIWSSIDDQVFDTDIAEQDVLNARMDDIRDLYGF